MRKIIKPFSRLCTAHRKTQKPHVTLTFELWRWNSTGL